MILIDGHAVIFRAFYAYPPLNTPKGELVNAVYGFASILLNVIRELQPTHIALSFDLAAPTFRHIAFANYKANREETPQDLIDQVDRVREVVSALNIPIYTKEGFEADDVIGTIAQQVVQGGPSTIGRDTRARIAQDDKSDFKSISALSSEEKIEVIIVTGDKDAFQLVDDDTVGGSVSVYIPGRNKQPATIYDETQVEHRFEGLQPEQIIDLKGLAGDQSDNIPGVKGIGNKTAIKLLLKHRTIEGIYEYLGENGAGKEDKIFTPSVIKKLVEGKASAFESKKLATIIRDVPIDFKLDEAAIHDFDKQKVKDLFSELGFKSLLSKLPNDSYEQSIQEALF